MSGRVLKEECKGVCQHEEDISVRAGRRTTVGCVTERGLGTDTLLLRTARLPGARAAGLAHTEHTRARKKSFKGHAEVSVGSVQEVTSCDPGRVVGACVQNKWARQENWQ